MNSKNIILLSVSLILFLNCSIQKKHDKYDLKKLNFHERKNFIIQNINTLEGSHLGSFTYNVEKNNINLNRYDSILKLKLKSSVYPYDIYLLSNILIKKKKNKKFIENTLSSKNHYWNTKNRYSGIFSRRWKNKFWNFIKEKELKIETSYFSYNPKNYIFFYDFEKFFIAKTQSKVLGQNPILMLNGRITKYNEGELIEFFKEYEIIDIDYTSIKKSIPLYGKRGVDGLLSITTK